MGAGHLRHLQSAFLPPQQGAYAAFLNGLQKLGMLLLPVIQRAD